LTGGTPVLLVSDQNYEHLFKANAPPEIPPPMPAPGARGQPGPRHSHYVQSKVVRARERIEAEMNISAEEPPPPTSEPTAGTS
jgi:mitochondrial import inner membrane translocase subunit TIM16